MVPVHSFDIEDPIGDYGRHPSDSKDDRISLPADFSIQPYYNRDNPNVFDKMDLTEQDLNEIRRINGEEYIFDGDDAN